MTKNSQTVKDAIAACTSPLVMVALTRGELAAKKTELQAFTDGKGYLMVSNVPKLYSLVDGKLLSPSENASKKEIAGEDFTAFDELVTMKSPESDQLIGVDADLAFALAGEDVFCPLTGKEVKLTYVDTAEEENPPAEDKPSEEEKPAEKEGEVKPADPATPPAPAGDLVNPVNEQANEEDIEDMSGSSEDDIEDVDTSDSDSEEEEEEEIVTDNDIDLSGEEDVGDDEDDAGELAGTKALLAKYKSAVTVYEKADASEPLMSGNVVKTLNDDTFVVSDDTGGTFTVKATDVSDGGSSVKMVGTASPVESANQTVFSSETANTDEAMRLISLTGAGNSEVAVFVGGTHIGTLMRTKAAEKAQALFDDGKKLFTAFNPTLKLHYANPTSGELAKFGYEPVKFIVKVGQLFEKRLANEVAKVERKAETAAAERVSDMTENVELAFVGLNKGLFTGNDDLQKELASLLKRSGVANAEQEVRKSFAKHSKGFVSSVMEHAKVLNGKSADYLSGITETLARADFVGAETAGIENFSTSLFNPAQPKKPEVAGFLEVPKPTGNRFSHLLPKRF